MPIHSSNHRFSFFSLSTLVLVKAFSLLLIAEEQFKEKSLLCVMQSSRQYDGGVCGVCVSLCAHV